MKRKAFALGCVWIILVAAGIGAIVFLVRGLSGSVTDLMAQIESRRVYNDHSAKFATAATAISFNNATISSELTNAPTITPTPTDTPEVTETPTATNTEPATNTPTTAPTDTQPPTLPATNTKVAAVATLPPTNTKRAAAQVQASPTEAIPTASLTPTLVPTSTEAPTLEATHAIIVPTVVLPAARTERPQPTAIPSPMPRQKANDNDIINIVLMGSDEDVDPSDPSFRTDSLIIVSLNRTTNTVSMLSIPRDLYVYIHSLGMQRVNVAYQWGESVGYSPGGGWGLLQKTILWNMGIPVHYYARVSLTGFKKIVDDLGGVYIAADCPQHGLRFQGKYDEKNEPIYEPFELPIGYHKMDGSFALWYARNRTGSSDFDRNRRQQQVLRAIWRTAREQGLIAKAPELWEEGSKVVQTNLQLQDIIGLIPMALSLQPGDVRGFYMIKGYETQHWRTPNGEDVQIPFPGGYNETIHNFYTPPTNALGADAPTVEVINASGNADWDKVAVDSLTWKGFAAVSKGEDTVADKTVVYDYTGDAKPGALKVLMEANNIRQNQVISQPDPNRTSDFKIVLGKDYNSCTAPGFGG